MTSYLSKIVFSILFSVGLLGTSWNAQAQSTQNVFNNINQALSIYRQVAPSGFSGNSGYSSGYSGRPYQQSYQNQYPSYGYQNYQQPGYYSGYSQGYSSGYGQNRVVTIVDASTGQILGYAQIK